MATTATTATSGDMDSTGSTGPECGEDADCTLEDGGCFEAEGACVDGLCSFTQRPAGASCVEQSCPGTCDAAGDCIQGDFGCDCADDAECSALRASGECVEGACVFQCEPEWGNCDGDWATGCEMSLSDPDNCGACGEVCTGGDHVEAHCVNGTCERSCEDPWEDCDESWDNGCEIPTGVPNQCDIHGLNSTTGCGTAWCGRSSGDQVTNFGSWHCKRCINCNTPSSGMCQYCDWYPDGNAQWFPAEACTCDANEASVCS